MRHISISGDAAVIPSRVATAHANKKILLLQTIIISYISTTQINVLYIISSARAGGFDELRVGRTAATPLYRIFRPVFRLASKQMFPCLLATYGHVPVHYRSANTDY
jgi:hypothetical protein